MRKRRLHFQAEAELDVLRDMSRRRTQYPDAWKPQGSVNTELVEVAICSQEVKHLVEAVNNTGNRVLKVSPCSK